MSDQFTPGPWLDGLDPDTRDRVFAAMRSIDALAQAASARERAMKPGWNEVSAGAGEFDEFVRAEASHFFLRGLRLGLDPTGAAEGAKTWAREAVALHNAKRPKDIHGWLRDKGTADGYIETALSRVDRAAQQAVRS